jgi:hypothetical protein
LNKYGEVMYRKLTQNEEFAMPKKNGKSRRELIDTSRTGSICSTVENQRSLGKF